MRPPSWDSGNRAESAARALAQIDRFVSSEAIVDLVNAWDGKVAGRTTLDRLEWLEAFSAAHWDFRSGKERNEASMPSLSFEQESAASQMAGELGMLEGTDWVPDAARYDAIVILGGLVRACVVRTQMAAEVLDKGVDCGEIASLAGLRAFGAEELTLATQLGLRATNEFEALGEALSCAFPGHVSAHSSVSRSGTNLNEAWATEEFAGTPPAFIVAAPSSEPHVRRANTADTLRWWLGQKSTPAPRSLLFITNPIYTHYQASACIAVAGIELGCSVEFVGASRTASDLGELTQTFSALNCLQEIRSTIRGYKTLLEVLDQGG